MPCTSAPVLPGLFNWVFTQNSVWGPMDSNEEKSSLRVQRLMTNRKNFSVVSFIVVYQKMRNRYTAHRFLKTLRQKRPTLRYVNFTCVCASANGRRRRRSRSRNKSLEGRLLPDSGQPEKMTFCSAVVLDTAANLGIREQPGVMSRITKGDWQE